MLKDTLKRLRTDRKLTRRDIEKKLGITERNIKSYELGTSNPSLEVLVRLADFYEVSTDYLLGREEKKYVEDVSKMSDNDLDKKLMQFFVELPESSKQGIRDFMMSVVNGLSETQEPPSQIVQTKAPEPTKTLKISASDGKPPKVVAKETLDKIAKATDITDNY